MKKTFLAKRNALLSSASASWGALALALAIVVLGARLLLPNVFWYTFSPLFHISNTLASDSHVFIASFGDASRLTLQNETLANENAALALENQTLLQKMNSISGLGAETRGIVAGVVARPPLSPYDTLMLSVGSGAGITSGMEAFGEGGVPLGVVSSIQNNFSRITLFSSPSMSTQGWVGKENVPLIIRGAGAGAMQASVPRSASIAEGDIVFLPGPGMLPIGSVVRIDSDPSSPSVTLRIQSAINLFSLGWVELRDTGIILP